VVGAAVVLAACVVVYLTSFFGAFVYDDLNQILNNPDLLPGASLSQILSTTPRPVTSLTFALNLAPYPDASIASPPPTFGFHAINLAIHCAAALALFGVLRRAMPESTRGMLPLAGALLWALHPLQTQSVTYIVQRAESLMGMFALIGAYLLLRCSSERRANVRTALYLAVVACSALAMGSKAVSVVLPLAYLLIDRTLISGSFVSTLRARSMLYLGLLLTLSVPFLTGIGQGVIDSTPNPGAAVGFAYEGISPFEYFISQPEVILHYLRLTFLPIGQCLDYAWPAADSFASALPSLLVISLLGLTALIGHARNTRWGLCLSLFFLLLAPTSSIIPIKDLAYEHRMYLPLAPIVVLVLMGVQHWLAGRDPRETKYFAGTAIVFATIALGTTTAIRNTVYHSDESVWRDVMAKKGNMLRATTNLASAARRKGDLESAINSATIALAMDSSMREARGILAASLAEQGDHASACEHYLEYFRDQPNRPRDEPVREAFAYSLNQLRESAVEHFAANRFDHAQPIFIQLTEFEPGNPDNWYNLGMVRARQNKFTEAMDDFMRALSLDPAHERAKQAFEIARKQTDAGK
jgi:tetratricopeptide (TPR) repeat protein